VICVTSLSFEARHHTKEPDVTASLPACATQDEIIVRIAQSGTAAHDLHLDCKTALGLCPGSQGSQEVEGAAPHPHGKALMCRDCKKQTTPR